jgi:hypothetical protein
MDALPMFNAGWGLGAHFSVVLDRIAVRDICTGCNLHNFYLAAVAEQLLGVELTAIAKAPWNPIAAYAGVYQPHGVAGEYLSRITAAPYASKVTTGWYVIINVHGIYIRKVTNGVFP